MIKKLLTLLTFITLLILPGRVLAVEGNTFVTITNPVRGPEGWILEEQKPIDIPIKLYEESSKAGLPSNWLLRYDAVTDATISGFFKELIGPDKLVSLGGLLEITPTLAQSSNINYPGGEVNNRYLSGYTPLQRMAIIDTFMETFRAQFGFYPRFVGAWHLDSTSLKYLRERYSVLTAMIIDEQFGVDSTRLWGGYLGSPYFPDKNNSLLPAKTQTDRIDITIVRWSQRDLFHVLDTQQRSNYAVQPDKYLALGLGTDYFTSLLNQYSQKDFNQFTYLNIGLENDKVAPDILPEIPRIYSILKNSQESKRTRFVGLEYFGNWMLSFYPENSPVFFYRTTDPIKNTGEIIWYQSPFYRIGLKTQNGETKIVDFRVYNRAVYEDHLTTANQGQGIYAEIPSIIDLVKNPDSVLSLGTDLSVFETDYNAKNDYYKLTIKDDNQKLVFTEDSIVFTNILAPTITSKDVSVTKNAEQIIWKMSPKPVQPSLFSQPWMILLLTLVAILFCLLINKTLGLGCLLSLFPLTLLLKDSHFFSFGQGFWGSNAHDAIFHLSIIEKIAQNPLNLSHPQLAGEALTNYHFVFDYLAGILVRLTGAHSSQIYFYFLPFAIAIVLTALIIKLLRLWRFSEKEILFSLIFVYLAGSLGFFPALISGHGPFSGESAFWANQSISIFLNPPFALSLLILVGFLLILEKYSAHRSRPLFITIIVLGGLLSQTKVYAFILLLGGLLFSGQWLFTVLVGLSGLLVTLPFSSMSGFPFILSPFWFIRSMFAASDRLNWERVAQAWQSYEATGSFLKLFILNFLGVIIFILGNLGTRVLGIYQIVKEKKLLLSQKILIWISVFGLLIPLVFTQKFNPWNSIQFFYYSLFVLGLFSGKGLLTLTAKKPALLILALILTLLTSVGSIKDHLGFKPAARVSYTETQALQSLRSLPRGVVLSPYYDGLQSSRIYDPKPLYAYASTAYISALSGQPEFLSDTINLDITGFDYLGRAKDVQKFFNTSDTVWAKGFLAQNNIKYIYETPLKRMKLSPESLSLTKVFESGEINIYQTK